MILQIKPIFNPITKQIDFMELIFKNITNLIENSNQILSNNTELF